MRNRLTDHSLRLHRTCRGTVCKEDEMGKAIILWFLGVPLGVVILLYLFFFR